MAGKINTESVKELFETIKNSAISSPFVSRASKFFEQAEAKGVADIKVDLDLEEEDDDIENPGKVSMPGMVNKLVKYFNKMILKIADHAKTIKFNRDMTEAVKVEVDDLKEKCKVLEELKKKAVEVDELKTKLEAAEQHSDDIQQRSMKGNLIVNSPQRPGKPSLMVPQQKPPNHLGVVEMENATDMCIRLIKEKTGVEVLVSDVSACHKLGGAGVDASYIVRIFNRRPGSAWEVLAAGLLTGKNSANGKVFTDKNVFINFQLTKKRSSLAKEVRNAKVAGSIVKYGTDQNGKITVRVGLNSGWAEVTSSSSLQAVIANPPVAKPRAWQQQPRQQ